MSVGRDGSVRRVRAIGRLFHTDDDGEDVSFSVFFCVSVHGDWFTRSSIRWGSEEHDE